MYEYQLGITGYKQGYKHFILQPTVGANYTSLSGSYESNYGIIRSAWIADGKGNMLSYKATVPANTTATEYELKAGTFEFNIMERKGIFIKKQTENRFTP